MKAVKAALLAISLLFFSAVIADSFKHITQVIDASDLEKLHLDISVGELDIETYDGDEIQLEVDITAQRRWFSFRSKDVEDIELEIDGSGPRVYIGLREQDIEQDWRIRLPAKLELELDMGVGDVHIEDFTNSLDMELGVGSVRIDVSADDYDLIHANAGVGDSRISGFEGGSDNERNFISADSYYHGEGDKIMEVELGVGDVEIRRG
ncbi:MAG: hypothetical protein GKR91_01640 [Pseudomonadales bacterium]|nr:hypothetical protein [Pseudomonadales bacterium]